MIIGGAFKRKEMLSGRFADALGYMFYASAILKKYEDDGRPRTDMPLVEWATKYCLFQTQAALDEVLRNFPIKWLGVVVRMIVFPLGLSLRAPNNSLSHRVAALLIKPGEARDRLSHGIHISHDRDDITGCLEDALEKSVKAEPIMRHLRAEGQAKSDLQDYAQWIDELLAENHLTDEEAEVLLTSHSATRKVIMVDEFTPEQMGKTSVKKSKAPRKTSK